MINCGNCGNQLIDAAKFCSNCGEKVNSHDSIEIIHGLWDRIFPTIKSLDSLENYESDIMFDDKDKEVPNDIQNLKESFAFSINEIELMKNSEKENVSVLEYPDGIYIGELKNGLRNGKGTFLEKPIGVNNFHIEYCGNWLNDLRSGFGISFNTYHREFNFKGEWERDLYNGQGTSYYHPKYNGRFVNGSKDGFGTEFYEDGIKSFEGEFINDYKFGKGIEYKFDGSKRYECSYQFGYKHGNGIEYGENGLVIYDGEWYMDLKKRADNYYDDEFYDEDDDEVNENDMSPIISKDSLGLR